MVLAAHAAAWQIAAGGLPARVSARAGVPRLALLGVPVPRRAQVPVTTPDAGVERAPGGPPAAVGGAARAAPAGEGGSRQRASPRAAAWPVYPTRPPPSANVRYALVQGGAASAVVGGAALEWRQDAATFSLRLAVAVAGRPAREWQSTGTFDAAGVAPLRLVERQQGRDRRALTFDRAAGVVRFSGASRAPSVAPGVQDRWSWIAQLAAVAEAGARRGERPRRWELQVAGLRGELERWTFRVLPAGEPPPELRTQGNELSASGNRAPALLHVLRDPLQPYDLRIEAWLSPSLHHLPAGLRMSTPPGPWSLSLWQRDS